VDKVEAKAAKVVAKAGKAVAKVIKPLSKRLVRSVARVAEVVAAAKVAKEVVPVEHRVVKVVARVGSEQSPLSQATQSQYAAARLSDAARMIWLRIVTRATAR
jgi:hypothetical protein